MHSIFIDNGWHSSQSGESIALINPSTGEQIRVICRGNAKDANKAIESSRRAFDKVWSGYTPAARGRLLHKLAMKVLDNKNELTRLESEDCGKPLDQAAADVNALARYFEFYSGACDKFHGETIPYENNYTVFTWREPYGVTVHIVPWNYPMQIFGRCVAAALAAGNTCVIKPSEDACQSLLMVVELARDVGFPDGVINLVTGYGHEVGNDLVSHADVDYVSFTGSPKVGALVTKAAAENHTPVTLELGGKSPQIIFHDADLTKAIPAVIKGFTQNSGQTCSAGTRLLVHESIYEDVLSVLSVEVKKLIVGNASKNLDCGPLIRKSQLDRVKSFMSKAKDDGLSIAAVAQIDNEASANGFFFPPTVIRDVPYDNILAQDEVFGPVLAVMSFKSEEEAVTVANATSYGLVAGVWTADGSRQMRMARKIKSGQVFINNYGAAGGIELPFGGYKSSGHGREKGFEAMYSFTQLKTVAIKY